MKSSLCTKYKNYSIVGEFLESLHLYCPTEQSRIKGMIVCFWGVQCSLCSVIRLCLYCRGGQGNQECWIASTVGALSVMARAEEGQELCETYA